MQFLNLLPFPILVFLAVYLCSKAKNFFIKGVVISCFWCMTLMLVLTVVYFAAVQKYELEGIRGDPVEFFSSNWLIWPYVSFSIFIAGVELIALPIATLWFYRKWQFGLLSFHVAIYAIYFELFTWNFYIYLSLDAVAVVLGVVGWQRNDGKIMTVLSIILMLISYLYIRIFF